MGRESKASLACLAFFLSLNCAAHAAGWTKEPATFLGIALDSQFPGHISKCPTNRFGSLDTQAVATRVDDLCAASAYQNLVPVYGGPRLGFGYSIDVFTYDDKAGAVWLNTDSGNYHQLKSLMVDRYGNPTKSSSIAVTTKAGGKFTSEHSVWTGKKVEIVLEQLSGDINTSRVMVSTTLYQAQRNEKSTSDRQNAASKL